MSEVGDEIIIPEERINGTGSVESEYCNYSLNSPEPVLRAIDILKKAGINSITHPKVGDLFAGIGSVGILLVGQGWKPEDIHCFDANCMNKEPGFSWYRWDLQKLAKAIEDGQKLPEEVEKRRGSFDLVPWFYGEGATFSILADYFCRSGGVAFTNMPKEKDFRFFKINNWKRLYWAIWQKL